MAAVSAPAPVETFNSGDEVSIMVTITSSDAQLKACALLSATRTSYSCAEKTSACVIDAQVLYSDNTLLQGTGYGDGYKDYVWISYIEPGGAAVDPNTGQTTFGLPIWVTIDTVVAIQYNLGGASRRRLQRRSMSYGPDSDVFVQPSKQALSLLPKEYATALEQGDLSSYRRRMAQITDDVQSNKRVSGGFGVATREVTPEDDIVQVTENETAPEWTSYVAVILLVFVSMACCCACFVGVSRCMQQKTTEDEFAHKKAQIPRPDEVMFHPSPMTTPNVRQQDASIEL